MSTNQDNALVQPQKGSVYLVLGDPYTILATGEETAGTYALLEFIVQPQNGPPPHQHSREDEAFYILEGEFEFQIDGQAIAAPASTFIHAPRGQIHSFKNIGITPARMLCWSIPAGIEQFFIEVGQQVESPVEDKVNLIRPVSSEDIEKVLAVAPKYGISIFQ